jgi:hypothetical protein
MFAKLYDTDKGQVVVMIQSNEDADPEIRFYAEPEGLGVCSLAMSYDDWDVAEENFGKVNLAMAQKAIDELSVFSGI